MQYFSTQQLLGMPLDHMEANIGTGYCLVDIYCCSRDDGGHSSRDKSASDYRLTTTDPSG